MEFFLVLTKYYLCCRSSMVIRDLTLRSAASFGSFHLIRLLYDEYMFYLVEHRVAQATGETPIAVMGEFLNLSQRSKEEDDASMPSPTSGLGSLHVGSTTAVVGNSATATKPNHIPMVQLDGSTSVKRPKLSWWCIHVSLITQKESARSIWIFLSTYITHTIVPFSSTIATR